jgi:hypothetical protein
MAQARIFLDGSLSLTGPSMTLKKDKPQVITSQAEIDYWRSQTGVRVVDMKQPQKTPITQPAQSNRVAEIETFTRKQLKAMKNPKLIELAAKFEILLTGIEKKGEMVEAILEAQEGLG